MVPNNRLATGYSHEYSLSKTHFKRMDSPYVTNCRSDWPDGLKDLMLPFVKYQSKICRNVCFDKLMVTNCKCSSVNTMGMKPFRRCNRTIGKDTQFHVSVAGYICPFSQDLRILLALTFMDVMHLIILYVKNVLQSVAK